MKNTHTPNFTWICSWWPEIWLHEYLTSPIESSVNWPGYFLEPGQFTLISMGLGVHTAISCAHMNRYLTNLGCVCFFFFYHAPQIQDICYTKMQKRFFVMSSLRYPIEYRSDGVTFSAFQRFEYHISVAHDEKPPQSNFGGNRFMGAWDMAAGIPK